MSEGKYTHINKYPFLLSYAEGCCSLASDKANVDGGLLGIRVYWPSSGVIEKWSSDSEYGQYFNSKCPPGAT